MRAYPLILLLLLVASVSCVKSTKKESISSPLSVRWELIENSVSENRFSSRFIITNVSKKPLDRNWRIYYAQLPNRIINHPQSPVQINVIHGNSYCLQPSPNYISLLPGDSIVYEFISTNYIIKESWAPEGAYFIADSLSAPIQQSVIASPFTRPEQWSRKGVAELPTPSGAYQYKLNERFSEPVYLHYTDILPSIKQVNHQVGETIIKKNVNIQYNPDFSSEIEMFQADLTALHGIYPSQAKSDVTRLTFNYLPKSHIHINTPSFYTISILNNTIQVQGSTNEAIYNATQTLLSLFMGQKAPFSITNVNIEDYPDFEYRGFMLDIARNFTTKDNLKKLITQLSRYKINKLHLHFSDDEGWRIQIKSLPELTTVGARRGHTYSEQDHLIFAYDGGADPNDLSKSGNGHYTQEDFIEILQHAAKHHIQIIPEIESPGHARAAVVAMKSRYHHFLSQGDTLSANKYLLSHPKDTSIYTSVQEYNDNVMDIGLESTYRFLACVVDELTAMYKSAGLTLSTIHIGGDEVPKGVWLGSPAVQKLMKQQRITSNNTHLLSKYFLFRFHDILQSRGILTSGWQEIAEYPFTTQEKARYQPGVSGVYFWNTVPSWGGDQAPYHAANAGYPVVLCNVNNLYMDMSYNKHHLEPGLHWGGFVDEYVAFDLQPYNIYKSVRYNLQGEPNNLHTISDGKEALTPYGKTNIIGIQAQLFSESIRNYGMVEYYLFPKLFGCIERAWNATDSWMNSDTPSHYQKALSLYNAKITQSEMPRLKSQGVNFRISQPGIYVHSGMLQLNSAIKGATIHYTTDGTTPNSSSPIYQGTILLDSLVTKVQAIQYWQGKSSLVSTQDITEVNIIQ